MPLFQIPTKKHVEWLRKANACGSYEYLDFKQRHFYPFKDRFLRRFGFFDGYDKQVLIKECWACSGTGDVCTHCNSSRGCTYCPYPVCGKCGGSGEYSKRVFWLERRHIYGRVFHIPVNANELPVLTNPPVNVYSEKIQHEEVDPIEARKAALKLILVYEVETFTGIMWIAAKRWWNNIWEEYDRTEREMMRRGIYRQAKGWRPYRHPFLSALLGRNTYTEGKNAL